MDRSVAAGGDDWGYQPKKGGMAIEAKLGMFIIMILVSAFGFLVYRNVDRHQQQLAQSQQQKPEESPETPVDELGDASLLSEHSTDETGPEQIVLVEPELTTTAPAESSDDFPAWDEAPDNDGDSVSPMDFAAVEPPENSADPFSAPDFASDSSDSTAAAFDDPDPLDTQVAQTAEPQLALTNDSDEFDFSTPADEDPSSTLPLEFPELTEPEVAATEPEPALMEEDTFRFPDESPQELAAFDPEPVDEPAGEAQPFDDSDLPTETDNEPLLLTDEQTPSLGDIDVAELPFEGEPAFSETEPRQEIVRDAEDDLVFDSTPIPPEPRDLFDPVAEEPSFSEDSTPEIAMSDPADDESSFDFDVAETSEPELNPQPELIVAARDDDVQTDFPNSFEVDDAAPPLRLNEGPPANSVPPESTDQIPDTTDSEVAQFNDFELRETTDQEPSRLRPVTPAGGEQSADAFDVRGFAYENSVIRASAEEEPYDVCEVQAGDNYWRISRRMYGTSRYFSALALYNHHRVPDPKKLRPGMKVLIPDAEVLEQKYPQLFRDLQPREKAPSGYFVQSDGTPAYRVGERDTLSEIAQKHLGRSSRWIQIYRLNRTVLSNPNRLKPGTVIILPDSATNVQMVP